jgi:hypothetical protein
MDRARALAASLVAAAWLALLASSGGCEVAVGDAVPSFACDPGADTCPPGQVCDPATHKCGPTCNPATCASGMMCDPVSNVCTAEAGVVDSAMPAPDSGMPEEASAIDTFQPPVDTGMPHEAAPPPDGTPTCNTIGCSCSGDGDCASNVCGDSSTFPSNLYGAVGGHAVCTQPCCTSGDCPTGSVCFPASVGGTGGNYCVTTTVLMISGTGAGQGGASCGTGRDCRSGVCSGSMCADTCCSDQAATPECASGTTCQFSAFPGAGIEVNYAAICATSQGTGTNGSMCTGNNRCVSGLCAADTQFGNSYCHDACRSGTDCGGGFACGYAQVTTTGTTGSTTAIVAACSQTSGGGLSDGAKCDPTNDMCQGFCDSNTMTCTDVCFADSDCSAASGGHCRPEKIMVYNNQGVSGGTFTVLACGT